MKFTVHFVKGQVMTFSKVIAGFAVLVLLGGVVLTQEVGKEEKTGKDKPATVAESKPATHKVEKKPFKIELNLKGILEAEEDADIAYRPHPMVMPPPSQGPLVIRQIAAHGTKVKKGDVVAAFDTRKIDEVIDDLEVEKKVLETSIKLAEEELPLFQKSVPADLAAAETAKKLADEDLKYFREVGRPEAEKMANYSVKAAQFFLEYAQEELRQLEKMYKANDLTEDTEKMILKRQRFYVDMEKLYLQRMLIQRDYTLKHTLPNKDKALAENQVRQTLALEKAQKTLEPMARQKHEALIKMRFDRDKNLARLEKIRKDREALTLKSPIDGIVYHGKFHKGQWTGHDGKLVPNGTVSPDDIFMTVVKPSPVVVNLTIEEKDVHLIKAGLEGKAKIPFHPDRKLGVKVTKLLPIPAAPGKFEAQVALQMTAAYLMPGMAINVKFIPYSKKEAIAVPTSSINEDEDKSFVYVVDKKGKQHKREVTTGQMDGDNTEILSGLTGGEEILLDRPGEKKTPLPPLEKEKGATP
jgi:multidrug efflux pump subunit AcrA (membrane-fusion protein)